MDSPREIPEGAKVTDNSCSYCCVHVSTVKGEMQRDETLWLTVYGRGERERDGEMFK